MKTINCDNIELTLSRRTFLKRVMAFTGVAAAGVLLPGCGPFGGPPGGRGQQPETLEEFVGITTDGNVIGDLYPIHATGVSTEAVRTAAVDFLALLTEEQYVSAFFTVDDDEWRLWNNVDRYERQGLSLEEMSEQQRAAAYGLLEAALSTRGLEETRNVMRLNTVQGELLNDTGRFNEFLYWFTIMGEPSETEPWGFQIDGHHLVINYFVLGDQVVMAPVFLGSEPVVAPANTSYEGISILQEEQDIGLAFMNTLTAEQQSVAILSSSLGRETMEAGAWQDNLVLDYAGIQATEFTETQQTQLLELIALWVGHMRDEHAAIKMEEVQAHLDETYFAWVGETGADAVFYYRIQSPVVLIEFDHQAPGPLGENPDYAADGPTRTHIHSVIRTPNGNDYGRDLLRQHLLAYDHQIGPDGSVVHVPRYKI